MRIVSALLVMKDCGCCAHCGCCVQVGFGHVSRAQALAWFGELPAYVWLLVSLRVGFGLQRCRLAAV